MIKGKMCTVCNIRTTCIVYRPNYGGKTRHFRIGEICKVCKDYEITMKNKEDKESS